MGEPADTSAMVRIEGLERSYVAPGRGRFTALSVPSLTVPRGGRLAVVGPNGSGKTTLLHLVAGLLRPDRGTIEVAGTRLSTLGEHALDRFRARTIGVLLHGGCLLEGLTAAENVMAALFFAGAPANARKKRAEDLLERFGVAHRARHRPTALSAGEQQRVALARALANDPPLLLADEPTANLDAEAAAHLVRTLDGLCRDEGRTLIVVTHRADEVTEGMDVLRLPGRAA